MSTSLWIVLALAVVVLAYAIVLYNKLVRHRNLVREGWSGVDVQLRRRADLVPNLVRTVQGYAAHEKSLFEEVAKRRAESLNAGTVAGKVQAERGLSEVLGRLFAVAEAYPALKADANFMALQQQLAELEDQLQMARRYYNGTARDQNILVESFPSLLVAKTFGFQVEPYFELDDEASRSVPTVAF